MIITFLFVYLLLNGIKSECDNPLNYYLFNPGNTNYFMMGFTFQSSNDHFNDINNYIYSIPIIQNTCTQTSYLQLNHEFDYINFECVNDTSAVVTYYSNINDCNDINDTASSMSFNVMCNGNNDINDCKCDGKDRFIDIGLSIDNTCNSNEVRMKQAVGVCIPSLEQDNIYTKYIV